MPCRIYLRHDQSFSCRERYSLPNRAKIFAPSWVKEALKILGQHLSGITFNVHDNSSPFNLLHNSTEAFTLTEDFNNQSLTVLQKIARNEAHNVSGVINKTLYPDVKDVRILYSIRDLVRQCVIVGVDDCSKCGGYRCVHERQTKQKVYICDLAALQFQQPYNSGRLILIQEEEPHKGILDDFIYEHVVGEKKRSFMDILRYKQDGMNVEDKKRYLPHDGFGLPGKLACFIDIHAYRQFVSRDLFLAGLTLSEMASAEGDKVNFKFLKYGTGFFAGKFQAELEREILSGVVDGLEKLFEKADSKVHGVIRRIELPFYKTDHRNAKRIQKFESNYGVNVVFSTNDALKQDDQERLIVATTNCGDNHAVIGNEMGFSSVDAAIAENLESKGNFMCPNINTLMTEQYLEI